MSRWRDVHLSAIARGVSVGGDMLTATALALSLQGRGESGMAVAGVLLAATVPLMLLAPVAGRLADRVDSRTLIVSAGSVQVVTSLLLVITPHPVAIVALVAVLASCLAVTTPTFGALVPAMVRQEDLPKAMAIGQTASSLGMLAGPALAGVLVGQFGVKVPLLLDAFTYVGIVLAGLLLRTRRGGKPAAVADPATAGTPAAAWRLRADTLLATMFVGAAVTVAALTAVNVADVFFVRETLGAPEAAYGLLGAVWTATMLVGSWAAARAAKRAGDGSMAVGLIGMLGATSGVILLCAAVPDVWWLVPLFVVGGVLNGGENVVASLMVARRVPPEVRGRAIGGLVGTVNAANVIGYLGGGVLLGVLAPRYVLVASGLAGVAAAVCCLPAVLRAVRREARVTRSAPEPAEAVGAG